MAETTPDPLPEDQYRKNINLEHEGVDFRFPMKIGFVVLVAFVALAGCSNTAIVQEKGVFKVTASGTVGFYSPEKLIANTRNAYEKACGVNLETMSNNPATLFGESGSIVTIAEELDKLAKLGKSILDVLPTNTYNATFVCKQD